MKFFTLTTIVVVLHLLLLRPIYAHGEPQYIEGIVESATEHSIVVRRTNDAKRLNAEITLKTKIAKSGKATDMVTLMRRNEIINRSVIIRANSEREHLIAGSVTLE